VPETITRVRIVGRTQKAGKPYSQSVQLTFYLFYYDPPVLKAAYSRNISNGIVYCPFIRLGHLLSPTTSFLNLPLVPLGSRELSSAFPRGLTIDSPQKRTTVVCSIFGRQAQAIFV